MNKHNVVYPNVSNQLEIKFQTELKESDRFKDLSLLIYQQNSQLYKLHFANLSKQNNKTTEETNHVQQSQVCNIL